MSTKQVMAVGLATLVFSALFVALSFAINVFWLGPAHEPYDFFRPDDDWRVVVGLPVNTLVWGALFALSYRYLGAHVRVAGRFLRGAAYGGLVFVAFILCQELYYYLFIRFDFVIIAGALLHYLLAFTLGGGLVACIIDGRS